MRLVEFLDRLASDAPDDDTNLSWLKDRLDQGFRATAAQILREGPGQPRSPWVALTLELAGRREVVPVAPGRSTIALLRERLAGTPLEEGPSFAPAAEPAGLPSALAADLKRLFRSTGADPPEQRAARLMDWILERIDASRCALVPFAGGTPAVPLAFRSRLPYPGDIDPAHIPRRLVARVGRARQPATGSEERSGDAVEPDDTVLRQRVRSYLAVPVIFRGELLAVCYVDRLHRGRAFRPDERAAFEAFSYELARPLLDLLDEQRRREYQELRDGLLEGCDRSPPPMSGAALAPVLERARLLAPHVEENILILGETGAGKEVLARCLHDWSGRGRAPFVPVNVSAIPSDLFESELMGSVRGAFTGAVDRPGRIEQAEGGTLFLDEIGDLPLAGQVKLLRFLEDKQVAAIGGRTRRRVDARVVAATNRPLAELMRRGEFRADLFHRFAPPLVVPPLRERRDEILPHARAWLERRARRAGLASPELSLDARDYLQAHAWPGNVRQLEAVLSHALLLAAGGRIERHTLASILDAEDGTAGTASPAATAPEPPSTVPARTWAEWQERRSRDERAWLEGLLGAHGGTSNLESLAHSLGCPPSTLRYALRRHGLRPAAQRPRPGPDRR